MEELRQIVNREPMTPERMARVEALNLSLAMAEIPLAYPQEERLAIYYRYRHQEALEAGREPEILPYLLAPEVSPRR